MARPRFSEMLIARRRQLGLSISQASKVLKLKEQVLIAFEEGDFSSIPKSGYAQGMLSSYARYLGLNPREVVDQFSEDLYEELNGTSSHELRRRTRASRGGEPGTTNRMNVAGAPGVFRSYADPDDLLGDFDTTSQVHSRGDSWGTVRSTQLVNPRRDAQLAADDTGRLAGYQSGYSQRTERYTRPGERYSVYDNTKPPAQQQRPYTARTPVSSTNVRPRGQRRSQTGPYAPSIDDATRNSGYGSRDVYRREVRTQQYVDDLRYDDETTAYEAASTQIGRRGSRNIASTERPNVQRSSSANRRELRRRDNRRDEGPDGILGAVMDFFSEPRRIIIVVLGVLAVVLTVVIIGSVRSCVEARMDNGRHVSITEVASTEDESETDAATTDEAATTDDAATTTEPQPVTETSVTVKLADGAVSWIEIECDGRSIVADTLTGPWSQTFVVTESISVQAGDTSAVTVTRNGEQVQFTSKASGVGSLTIEGTKVEAQTDDAGEGTGDAEGSTTDGQNTSNNTSTDTSSSGDTEDWSGPGYYDENGVWQEGYADE